MQKPIMATMYQDRNLLGLIIGSLATALFSIFANITKSDVSFFVAMTAGVVTIVSGLIKSRRDWKEAKFKPFWRPLIVKYKNWRKQKAKNKRA